MTDFPDASDLHGSRDSATVIAESREDLMLLQREKDPVHAAFKTGLYDGGTRHFEGLGYRFIDHRRLMSEGGRNGKIVGQTIIFDRSATGGSELEYSNARFVPSKQPTDSEQGAAPNP